MRNIEKIAVLGGDARQAALAAMLADNGYETATWAVMGDVGNAVRCSEWSLSLLSADAVVLPIVAEDERGRLNAPFASDYARVPKLNDILEASDGIIFGGKLPQDFVNCSIARGREVIDYFLSEELQILNALPTAEGAIAVALENLDVTIYASKILVVGYGRIGKTLSSILHRMGANVDVAARRGSDLARIEIEGIRPQRLFGDSLASLVSGEYDAVFNTVPCVLFNSEVLRNANPKTLYIDLASNPGGFDLSTASERGLRVLKALSLPGKYFPRSAGNIIGKTILNYLSNLENN